jgi:hypothetical protein
MATPNPAAPGEDRSRRILITQCLQNDLFLNPDCRLYLSDNAVKQLLVAKASHGEEVFEKKDGHRRVKPRLLREGPLGLFLEATIGERLAGAQRSMLHVINIRDWHEHNESYDEERRMHGRHCEARTWGAEYIDGFDEYLAPAGYLRDGRAAFCDRGAVRVYHVHSDSIFDFRPRWEQDRDRSQLKFRRSHLERLLDVLVAGSHEQVEELATALGEPNAPDRTKSQALERIAGAAVKGHATSVAPAVYVAVIGVYTDVKIPILLAGLRARYLLPNLAVSDSLTGSRGLERHLVGLDFSDKLLRVEVIHSLGDLAAYVGSELVLNESEIVAAPDFGQYRTYFADKQNLLAHQSERLQEYVQLTEKRSIRVYQTITRANVFLLVWGAVFLSVSLITSLLTFFGVGDANWQIAGVTGGIGIVQVVAVFFGRPIKEIQQNLSNLASFKMILEGHSLKEAFTRYHLTTPEVLRELGDKSELDAALNQIEALRKQLAVIDQSQRLDYDALGRFVGLQTTEMAGAETASTNGVPDAMPVPDGPPEGGEA